MKKNSQDWKYALNCKQKLDKWKTPRGPYKKALEAIRASIENNYGTLLLSHLPIASLPENLVLKGVTSLMLNNTHIESLPKNFEKIFPKLNRLQISHQSILQLKDFSLPNLEKLTLDHNKISIPNDFNKAFPDLKNLIISDTHFEQMPKLPEKLESLRAYRNGCKSIEKLPSTLTHITIHENQLTSLDLKGLDELKQLNVSENQLTNLSNCSPKNYGLN